MFNKCLMQNRECRCAVYVSFAGRYSVSVHSKRTSQNSRRTSVSLVMPYSVLLSTIFSCDSSSIGRNISQSVCLSAMSSMEVLCCYQCICCYCCCSLGYKNILLSYFVCLAVIAALQVTMSVCNKFHTSYNAATSLCML